MNFAFLTPMTTPQPNHLSKPASQQSAQATAALQLTCYVIFSHIAEYLSTTPHSALLVRVACLKSRCS
jgi:hypothetical protein